MRIEELYPYWETIHDEMLDILEVLTVDQLDARPWSGARSIRQIIHHVIVEERFLIHHLAAGYLFESAVGVADEGAAALAEALRAARCITQRALEPLSAPGLRAVRTLPADPRSNRHESNVKIGWLFWQTMQHQIYHWGQIVQRIEDEKVRPMADAFRWN